jgi:hypothetical protein
MSALIDEINAMPISKFMALIKRLEEILNNHEQKGSPQFAYWMELRNGLYQGMMAIELQNQMRDELTKKESLLRFYQAEYERCDRQLKKMMTIDAMITDESLKVYAKAKMEMMHKRKIDIDKFLNEG